MITRLLERLRFRRKIAVSFGVMILLLTLNALIGVAVVATIIEQTNRRRDIREILVSMGRMRVAEAGFIRSRARGDAQSVFQMLDSVQGSIDRAAAHAASFREQEALLRLLSDYRLAFQKFTIETDQQAALEAKTLHAGSTLFQRLNNATPGQTGLISSAAIAAIQSQLLEIQFTRDPDKETVVLRHLKKMESLLAAIGSQPPQAGGRSTDQRQLFLVTRDARDYAQAFDQYLKGLVVGRQTEQRLVDISGTMQQSCETALQQLQHTISIATTAAFALMVSLFVLSIIASLYLARNLSRQILRPILDLATATREISAGNRSARVTVTMDDEIGDLAGAFNRMTGELQHSEEQLREANRHLEQKVTERTAELSATLRELVETQNQLIANEKMAALGQLVAGISHDINTPLGVIKSSIEHLNQTLPSLVQSLPRFLCSLDRSEEETFLELVSRATALPTRLSAREERSLRKSLQSAVAEILPSEQMEAAGKVAGTLVQLGMHMVTPELAAALSRPAGVATLLMAGKVAAVIQNAGTIEQSVQRASKVVMAMKIYGRIDVNPVRESYNVQDDIEIVLTLYQNFTQGGIDIVREYGEIPSIQGFRDELNQVWMNLIHNALQAMDVAGQLTIRTRRQDDNVVVEIADTGPGIDAAILPKIFDPFFTTKPTGQGSGLGLHIVSRIIARHGGTIHCTSQPGITLFKVTLPITAPDG